MKQKVFSVFDVKAQAFLPPFFAQTVELAKRMVQNLVNDPQSNFHRYKADYTLFHIGEFDPESGLLTGTDKVSVCGLCELTLNSGPNDFIESILTTCDYDEIQAITNALLKVELEEESDA